MEQEPIRLLLRCIYSFPHSALLPLPLPLACSSLLLLLLSLPTPSCSLHHRHCHSPCSAIYHPLFLLSSTLLLFHLPHPPPSSFLPHTTYCSHPSCSAPLMSASTIAMATSRVYKAFSHVPFLIPGFGVSKLIVHPLAHGRAHTCPADNEWECCRECCRRGSGVPND